jgi:hypothetical protein
MDCSKTENLSFSQNITLKIETSNFKFKEEGVAFA